MSHFQMVERSREASRANTARELASYYAEMASPAPVETFSILRMLRAMAEQTFQSGSSYEANLVEAAMLSQGSAFDPQRAVVPWGALAQRDLNISTTADGGLLIGKNTINAADALRPHSVAARIGVTFLENQMQDLMVPNLSTPTKGQWLATETSAITNSDPVIGVTPSKPKTAGAMLKASRQFMLQASQGEAFIRSQLLAAMGDLLDQGILAGTGANGQPTGLQFATIANESSGDFNAFNAVAVESIVSGAGGNDDNLKFLTTPNIRGYLKNKDDGFAGRLWRKGQIVDRPAFVSTHCPSDMIFFGDWSQCLVALWGAGLDIQVDPYSSFKTGAVQVRILMHCDISFLKPESFSRWTLI